jgi:hypothetical protein
MSYLGDFYLGANVDHKFTTVNTSGVPTMLTGSPAVVAYPDNSTTELTSGINLTTNFDSRSGLNHVRIAATSSNGYATGTNYSLVITTGTVGGNFVGGYMVGEFSIEARASLRPASDGRDIALSPAGFVDVNDKSGYGLATGTLLDAIADTVWDEQLGGHLVTGSAGRRLNDAASAGSDPWSTSLPGSYTPGQAGHIVGTYLDIHISSRMSSGTVSVAGLNTQFLDTYVSSRMPSGTVVVAGLNTQYLDTYVSSRQPSGTVVVGTNNDKTGYSLSSPQTFNLIGNISGTHVGNHIGHTIGNTSGTWVGNISGTLGAVNGLVPSRLDVNVSSRIPSGTVSANLTQIDGLATNGNNATLNLKKLNIVNDVGLAVDISGLTGGMHIESLGDDTIGLSVESEGANGIGVNAFGFLASIFAESDGGGKSFIAPDGIVGNIVGNITGTLVGDVYGNVTGTSGIRTGTFIDAMADQVWDEQIAGHLLTGSTGKKLNDAGAAGDPWGTSLPASYTPGQAGYILGTNLNDTVSSRMPSGTVVVAGLNTQYLDTYVSSRMPSGTVIAMVTGTVNVAGLNPALLDVAVSSRLASGTFATNYVTPPTATENADELLKRDWTAVTGEAARSVLNALRKLRNKVSFDGANTLTTTKEDDATAAYTQSVVEDSNQDPFKSIG